MTQVSVKPFATIVRVIVSANAGVDANAVSPAAIATLPRIFRIMPSQSVWSAGFAFSNVPQLTFSARGGTLFQTTPHFDEMLVRTRPRLRIVRVVEAVIQQAPFDSAVRPERCPYPAPDVKDLSLLYARRG